MKVFEGKYTLTKNLSLEYKISCEEKVTHPTHHFIDLEYDWVVHRCVLADAYNNTKQVLEIEPRSIIQLLEEAGELK